MKRLKHKTECLIAKGRQIIFTQVGDLFSFDVDASAGRLIQAGEQAEQGGLSASAFAFDDYEFSVRNRYGHLIQNRNFPVFNKVGFG